MLHMVQFLGQLSGSSIANPVAETVAPGTTPVYGYYRLRASEAEAGGREQIQSPPWVLVSWRSR